MSLRIALLLIPPLLLLGVAGGYCDELPPSPGASLFVGLGAEYASGDYGTATTTRSLYVPLTITWAASERVDLEAEIPWLYQSSTTVTTNIFRTGPMAAEAAAMGSQFRGGPGGGGGGGGGGTSTSTTNSSVSGLGDVILRLGGIAHFEGEQLPRLRLTLFLKCPTASRSDGLGTGEYDAGGGLDLEKWVGRLHLLAEGNYTYQGRVPGYDLKNYLSWSGGVGYQISDTLQPLLQIKGATAPSGYAGELLEARARLLWTVSAAWSVDLYLARSLSSYGPDFRGGMTVARAF